MDSRLTVRIQYDELRKFLDSLPPPNEHLVTRAKLARLTTLQFQELRTDVFDDALRRRTNTVENE
ncbi:hypothetical protein FRC02_001381, partial [Tulasnella sp. 418]